MMSVDLKNQLKHKTSNIASKIKKLESKFSRSEEPTTIGSIRSRCTSPSLVSSSTFSNESFKSHQSPKFLQLFQNQMNININKTNKLLHDESNDQLEVPTSPTKSNNLRKMTSSSSIGSSSSSTSSASSTNEPIEYQRNEQTKVDSAPCVLPSFLRNRPSCNTAMTPAMAVNTITSHLSKVNPSEFHQIKPNKVVESTVKVASKPASWNQSSSVTTTRSSYAGGLVKNNAAIFNRNSEPLVTQGFGFRKVKTSATTAREALIRWCRNRTVDYDNVNIENFSSSWSNGLAFCALLHHFMPDAFDYEALDARNARFNFELAFKTAE